MERRRVQADKSPLLLAGLAVALLALGGCGRATQAANTEAGGGGQPGYPPPPELTGVAPAAGGAVAFSGVAAPDAAVRLATPSGAAGFTSADDSGHWKVTLPPSPSPRLLSLSMTEGGRVAQAMGYLFLTPSGAVVRLRAGGGSELLDRSAGGLAAQTLDYDDKGAATLAGRAPPGEAISLRVDGVERGQGQAGADGRFVVALTTPLTAGSHAFDLASPSGEAQVTVGIEPPAQLGASLFVAGPSGGGWRVDWLTPGGGEQTTVLLGASTSR